MGQRILLVDDEAAIREMTSLAIAKEGREIVEASSGEGALQLLAQGDPFDLVITDNRMPGGMYGTELVEAIRKMPGRKEIPIILASSDCGLTCEKCNVDAIIRKPFRIGSMRTVIDLVA